MTDPVLVALIVTIPAVISAINAVTLSRHTAKLERVSAVVDETNKQMDLLEKNTNSIKDALVSATRDGAHSAGVIEGIKSEQERVK
jgi:outer membrane murein-binding lipoprotein Lpp